MAVKSKTSIKADFVSAATPTESEFIDFIDSAYTGEIGAGLVSAAEAGSTGLFEVANASSASFLVPGSAGRALVSAGTGSSARSVISAASDASASTTQAGIIEIATTAETTAGTDETRAITPATLSVAVGGGVGIALPRAYFADLTLSNGTDTDHDIDITAGQCRDSANSANIDITSALTKQIDASWVAGTNQGGLSSSLTLSASTVYYLHAIIVGGSSDVGFDTSDVAANLVTDHSATAYRLIGQVVTDGSSNIVNGQFMQVTRGGKTYTFAEQATTSGTAVDWIGIDADATQIEVMFDAVSLSGSDNLLVQIGDSGGIEATGYIGTGNETESGADVINNVDTTTGFPVFIITAGSGFTGQMTLTLMDPATNKWSASHSGRSASTRANHGGGRKSLSDTLDRIRITRDGTNTFDLGSINIRVRPTLS